VIVVVAMPISMPIALGNMTTAAMPIASAGDVAPATYVSVVAAAHTANVCVVATTHPATKVTAVASTEVATTTKVAASTVSSTAVSGISLLN